MLRRVGKPGKPEMSEFKKEALRLIKELAADELALGKARKDIREYKCEGNVANSKDEAEYIEECMDRKTRLLETIIHY